MIIISTATAKTLPCSLANNAEEWFGVLAFSYLVGAFDFSSYTQRSFGMQDKALWLLLSFSFILLCCLSNGFHRRGPMQIYFCIRTATRLYNFSISLRCIAVFVCCSRSMQVSECVNRVGFQVAFRVTMHYYLQPGNKSQPRQFHACNVVSVTSVLAIVNTKQQQQQQLQQQQEQQTEWILNAILLQRNWTTAKIKWN